MSSELGPGAGDRPTAPERADDSRVPPRTSRGEATRRAILDAARELFSHRGFHKTTVPDIVKAARVGHGTFYEYFPNRREVLLELVREVSGTALVDRRPASMSLAERVRADVHWFLAAYVRAIDLTKIWVEAAVFDPKVAEIRTQMRAPLITRIRRGVEMAAPPGVDPEMAAVALAAMTEQFGYLWFVEGLGPGTDDKAVDNAADTIARLWLNSIGVADA